MKGAEGAESHGAATEAGAARGPGGATTPGRVSIQRYDPAQDQAPYTVELPFPYVPGMTVLDVVRHLSDHEDPSLGFEYCCRNSHCGLCGVEIDGTPGLMCREPAAARLQVGPLGHLPVVRDLIVDREPYAARLIGLRLFLERGRDPDELPERVDRAAHERFKAASRCVECLCCVAACPVYGERPHDFLGPAGFALLGRHAVDPRDDLERGLIAHTEGVERCTGCGRCSAVCPHGVDPAGIIEELRAI